MDLQAIEARLAAAPEPEKWQVEEGWEGYRVFYKDDGHGDLPIAEEICQGTDSGEALAEFIAHAPKDMRALIDEVGRLSGLLDVVKKIHEKRVDPDDPDGELLCDACRDEWGISEYWPCSTMRALGVTE